MINPTVIICVDGLDPEYLKVCNAPNLMRLGHSGFFKTGQCIMPSVTNVNNVSLVTATYPETHGISSNYRLIPCSGEEIYMESGKYILSETMFERAHSIGEKSVLVTSKDKLRTLLSHQATISVSSEQPPDWIVNAIGPAPNIYSLEVNGWAIRAATHIMSTHHDINLVYISTTDYAMHTYAPDEPQSQKHITILDDAIGNLIEEHPDITLFITADHGMSQKTRMVDLETTLGRYGINARAIPIIKDRYVVHHANLGGCIFVYLDHIKNTSSRLSNQHILDEAFDVICNTPGVEDVLLREEATKLLRLHHERIGDIVVTGEADVVFGNPTEVDMPPRLRSHASNHEREIPLLGYNGDFDGFTFKENRDIGRYVFKKVLSGL